MRHRFRGLFHSVPCLSSLTLRDGMPTRRNRVASSVFPVALQAAKSLPALGDGVCGRDERQSRLGAKSNMQSAVTNGAASRAHRILEVFESLRGLKSLRGCANDYRLSTNDYPPFVTAIYNSIQASSK